MFNRKDSIKDQVVFPNTGRVESTDDEGNVALVDQPVEYANKPDWLTKAEDAEQIIYEYSVNENCYYAVIKDGDDRIKVAPGETIAITKDNKIICTGVSENE